MALELHSEVVNTPPVAAATVMLLRDTSQGMQVLLLKRHSASEVLGGAYVFPGGKIDASDAAPGLEQHLDQTPANLREALNESDLDNSTAISLYLGAARELYEECGVLLATDPAASDLTVVTAATVVATVRPHQPHGARATSGTEENSKNLPSAVFNALLAEQGFRLNTLGMRPWSRWITPRVPSMMRKRFDTRFFVAMLPQGQQAKHDAYEATESVWLTPHQALQRYWQGEIEMAPPQLMSLAHLAHYTSASAALAAAAQQRPALIQPQPHDIDGIRVMCYPGDPLHTEPRRAMPGPTRLYYRNQRFEPADGFEAWTNPRCHVENP